MGPDPYTAFLTRPDTHSSKQIHSSDGANLSAVLHAPFVAAEFVIQERLEGVLEQWDVMHENPVVWNAVFLYEVTGEQKEPTHHRINDGVSDDEVWRHRADANDQRVGGVE